MERTRYFYDENEEKVYTLGELMEVYTELKNSDETETSCFHDWLNNCTSKNGSLEEFTWYSIDYYVQNNFHGKTPIVEIDYETGKHTWIYHRDNYIVVPDFHECIVNVDGEIVAYGIHVMKVK